MAWQSAMWYWMVYAAVSSCLLFAAAVLAMMLTDQPVRRLRFVQWAFAGALLAPLVHAIGATPQWHLGLVDGDAPPVRSDRLQPVKGPAEAGLDKPAGTPPTIAESGMQPEFVGVPHPATKRDAADVKIVDGAAPAGRRATRSQGSSKNPGISTAPAASESETADFRVDLPALVLLAYSGIAGGMLIWSLLGMLQLMLLKRRSRPAAEEVNAELRRIAGDDPRVQRVRVCVSDRVPAPLTYGWRRPVIVLPEDVCQPGAERALRYCLAHEWDHVRRRDILPWRFAGLLQAVFFYQPLFWWLRRQLRLCQDYLADAFAARQADVPEDYAEFLVEQAKRCSPRYSAALGFVPSRSSLFRRVEMILNDEKVIAPRCRRWWSVAVGLAAVGVVAALAAVRLDAGKSEAASNDANEKARAKPPAKVVKKPEKAAKSMTYNGVVVDRISKKPIKGTTVIIVRTLSNPPKGMEDWKKTTRAKSDADGKYSFTLGPEETAQSSLYIEVDAQHPDYVAKGRSGYAHSMILKNLKMGEKPFYATIELWPGTVVTGTVVSPDGKPVKDVEVLTYSKHSKAKRFSFGGFYTAHTDAKGRFRFVAATPGEGVYWITPKGFAPQAHVIPEKRGDVGRVVLQHGEVIKGKVLDAKGKPVPNVQVEARRNGDGEDVDRFLGQNAVANHIGRRGKTNAKGEFQLDEVPSGKYTLNVRPVRSGWAMKPLEQVFVRQPLTISDGERPAPLEIRAVPHVEIHVKWVDSKGKPSSGWRFHVFGRMDKGFFFAQSSRVDRKTGHAVARVPHGLQKTQVSISSNEHGSLRWRLKPGEPLRVGRRIDFGTLEADVHGFEIIRYVAPILLVKAVDEKGKLLKDFKPKAVYEKGKSPKDPNSRFINGVRGDVGFEKQTDGRWRSSQLLPDVKLTVTSVLDGYTTKAQTVSLKEGSTRELVFVMKPQPAEKKPAAAKTAKR